MQKNSLGEKTNNSLKVQSCKLYNDKYTYNRFSSNDKYLNFRIHNCSSF